jgi:1-acyl-sn-glycerol-3-phosphate acyltransferase
MKLVRSLLYTLIFYGATGLLVLGGLCAALFGRRAMLRVIRAWTDLNHWLAADLLGIHTRVVGAMPPGPHLIAAKHQSMFETVEIVRITGMPVIVMKRELSKIPFFGWLTQRYGVILVERSAGAKALRALVAEGRKAAAKGRSVIIYPEGTRVRVGETPPLRPGFMALYRALGLPIVPVALDSGRLWGRGFTHDSGTITFQFGEPIPPGLKRDEVEARVHAAINALELSSQPSA